MNENGFKRAILTSIAIHSIVFGVLFTATILALIERHAKRKTIEITVVEKTRRRVVKSDLGEKIKTPPKNSFLGKENRVVEKETVANQTSLEEPLPPASVPTQSKSGKVALKNLGVPLLNSKNVPVKLGGDYVRGVPASAQTALNTREFVYYSYFQRIREQLNQTWVTALKDELERMGRRGRFLASGREHTTRTLVTLNKTGRIIRIQVLEESGTRDLDTAAIDALNKVNSFPNPPKGLVKGRESFSLRWDFTLKT